MVDRNGEKKAYINGDRNGEGCVEEEEEEYPFPISHIEDVGKMKNINPSVLPHFYGFPTKDPNIFLFEFLCRTYEYKTNSKKLRLFPFTLKDVASEMVHGVKRNKYRFLGRNEGYLHNQV